MSNSSEFKNQCEVFGRILGVSEPVSEEVLHAAISNPSYAHKLLVSRGENTYLDHLLENPPRVNQSPDEEEVGSFTLIRRAAESITRWARTGFTAVSDEEYHRRLERCSECPYLKKPPKGKRILYGMAGAKTEEPSVCGKCGCVVTEKARRVSDTCPDPHPAKAGLNRWEEPHLLPPSK